MVVASAFVVVICIVSHDFFYLVVYFGYIFGITEQTVVRPH